MSSALDEFRAQREAVIEVRDRLSELTELLRSVREQTTKLAEDDGLCRLLREEQTWLARAEKLIRDGQYARSRELERFWSGVWRRWVIAMSIAFATAFAGGVGYVWAEAPYRSEISSLRARVDALDFIAQRFMAMSPAERDQFDRLIKPRDLPRH